MGKQPHGPHITFVVGFLGGLVLGLMIAVAYGGAWGLV